MLLHQSVEKGFTCSVALIILVQLVQSSLVLCLNLPTPARYYLKLGSRYHQVRTQYGNASLIPHMGPHHVPLSADNWLLWEEVKLARILPYDEKTGTWLAMESMTTPRYKALVASLQDKVMMVVGVTTYPVVILCIGSSQAHDLRESVFLVSI